MTFRNLDFIYDCGSWNREETFGFGLLQSNAAGWATSTADTEGVNILQSWRPDVQIKAPTDLVSGEGSLPGSQEVVFSLVLI